MEGSGAYTVVDGHKMTLGHNDFVLTPNGTRHEHAVAEDGTPCIWQDGLDIPCVNALEANFYDVHPELTQTVAYPVNDMTESEISSIKAVPKVSVSCAYQARPAALLVIKTSEPMQRSASASVPHSASTPPASAGAGNTARMPTMP